MKTLTKPELLHSFRSRNTKRRDALYSVYQEWFGLPLTAPMLAERITADLGIRVSASIIYHIRSKHRPTRQLTPSAPVSSVARSANQGATLLIPEMEATDYKQPSPIVFLTD